MLTRYGKLGAQQMQPIKKTIEQQSGHKMCGLCCVLNSLLLLLLAWRVPGKPATELDEDCELNASETMHDFCCDLHDEGAEFLECQTQWHDKIHYTTEQEEQTFLFCTAECTFNATEFLQADRKSLNLREIRHHLESNLADAADEALLYQTYIKCDKHALQMLTHKGAKSLGQRLAKQGCHPYPGLVMECVANEMILNCPAQRFHNTAPCQVTRDYLRSCMQHNKYKA